ncbi:MAG: Hsp20/alpha crystallin family protein [Anaerolineae bacterium]|nr:Hsp20/alpha crystallin family protein [Anaerolineae bacterium]
MSTLMRWNPLRELQNADETFERFFDDPWLRSRTNVVRDRAWRMPLDAYMTGDALVVTMELPGVNPDDVEITLENNVLTIRGELHPRTEEERNYVLRERPAGRFERALSINTPVDTAKTEATFADGLLTLTLHKAEEAKPKTIAIKKK